MASQSNHTDDQFWFGKLELKENDRKLIASGTEMIPHMTDETIGDESEVSSVFKARLIWMSWEWIMQGYRRNITTVSLLGFECKTVH